MEYFACICYDEYTSMRVNMLKNVQISWANIACNLLIIPISEKLYLMYNRIFYNGFAAKEKPHALEA